MVMSQVPDHHGNWLRQTEVLAKSFSSARSRSRLLARTPSVPMCSNDRPAELINERSISQLETGGFGSFILTPRFPSPADPSFVSILRFSSVSQQQDHVGICNCCRVSECQENPPSCPSARYQVSQSRTCPGNYR